MKEKMTVGRFFVYLFVIVFSLACLYPFLMVIGGSLMTNSEATTEGFKIFPKEITFASYKMLLANGKLILNGYKITVFVTVVGTFCSIIVNGMMGYVLSRKKMAGRKVMNIYVLITMLFNGGMVPWYMICTQYLHLKNTIWALILPMVVNAWYIFLIRNYFSGIPEELWESAKLDGASEFKIFYKIYLILAKPVIATIVLFAALGYWNDWWLGLMLMEDTSRQPLQMLLRTMMSNIQFLQTMSQQSSEVQAMLASVPGDGVKMAMVIITTGPIILLYPFLQKYFMKGIMVGAVKG
ncbi:MAG: carbohydrate ABC transporter permease [Lachnospiraceae bacterium]|nr:carbohydrate ABC transporter permease [Lachnospiraceae bacterium]